MVRAPRFANRAANGQTGHFFTCPLVVVIWAVTGPFFGYSDTWQLVINTGTTIVTFLMVFLIQNTQTRDTMALQLKLDELIMATKGARNSMVGLEDASDEDLSDAKDDSHRRAEK
jgi:low affinity Fe/Cu permease